MATTILQRKISDLTRRTPRATRSSSPRRTLEGRENEATLKLGHLSETEVFSSLSGTERTWLMESTTMVTCERGRVFYTPNEQSEVVFILKHGRVDLYRLTADGRKLVVASIGAHTIFGEMALIGQGMYGCYAEAAEECLICVLSRADLHALVHRNPDVGLRLLAEVSTRLQQRETELESLAFQSLPSRLAALLIREADAFGTISGYSQQDLAERLGTYRETVSQMLGRFKSEGLVSVEPKRIRVIDPNGLQSYAET